MSSLQTVRFGLIALLLLSHSAAAQRQQQTTRTPQASTSQTRDLQSMLQSSGLSLEQIRSLLRAQGIEENVLDAYYSGRNVAPPDSNVFAAVRALGISSAPQTDSSRREIVSNTRQVAIRDSLTLELEFLDSVSAIAKDDSSRTAVLAMLRSRDLRRTQLDSGFTLFGASVFQRGSTLFDPNETGPTPPDYRLGPGDELILVLTGDTERAHELTVTREGMVFIPNVGGVAVANLTMRQLEDVLWTRLARVYSGIRRGADATAHFQVSVSKLGSVQVSVLGDVGKPGAYRVSKIGTVMTALYAAGGPAEGGSFRRVDVMRAGKQVATLDLYDYLVSGNSSNDVRLESGDIVLVRSRGPRARIAGAVVRPATYELRDGQTLGDLIRMAGGFRPEADRRRVQVRRVLPPEARTASGQDRVLFDVAGASLEASREPLSGGDVVTVSPIANKVANQVSVTGNVWSPGPVAITPGMTVADAIARAGGAQPDTYLDGAQLSRLQPDSTRRMLRLSLNAASVGGRGDTVRLQPDDSIRVFSVSEYRPARTVQITGAVRRGGRIAYREGMTLRDALMLAGGMSEGALLTEAEVARMPEDRAAGTTATTVRVPLDSSYLFDRNPGSAYLGPPGIGVPTRTTPEFVLKAYDNVLILRQPEWLTPRTVYVGGEVRYPGDYTLQSKSETLVDIVTRAGGLTRDAYAEGIVFVRSQNQVGRIGIDLPAAMKNKRHPDNLLLTDADSITIPFRSAVVMVRGRVNSPVAVPYLPGQDLNYYVYGAGGPSAGAALKKAYVLQPSGKVESRHRKLLLFSSIPTPQPGSVISVPEAGPSRFWDVPGILAAVTSMFTSTIALVAILRNQ